MDAKIENGKLSIVIDLQEPTHKCVNNIDGSSLRIE